MDIGEWLGTAADRDAPDPNKDCFILNDLAPELETQLPSLHQYRAKRKRSLSDSPRLNAREAHNSLRKQVSKPDPRTRRRRSSSVAHSPQDNATRRPYEKRARHKTRPELYDAEATKRQKVAKKHAYATPKPRYRKSYSNARGATRTAGLVQEFYLKTGPKDKRLTLKPKQPTVGLFKHGRASTQATGRGSGLPDLVFNEMRFLQRPISPKATVEHGLDHDHPEPDRIVSSTPKQGISGYFMPSKSRSSPKGVRSKGVQARLDALPHHGGEPLGDQASARPEQMSSRSHSKSLRCEQPDTLGLQSAAEQQGACPSPDDTAYTWSVSDALPQLSRFQPRPWTLASRHKGHDTRPQHDPQNVSRGHDLRSSLSRTPFSRGRREATRLCTRDKLPHTEPRHTLTIAKTRQAPHNTVIGSSKRTSTSKCLSLTKTHSPTVTSTVSRRISRDNDSLRGGYRTSDILNVRRRSPEYPEEVLVENGRNLLASQSQEDPGLDTSTPIGRLLRQAHEATTFQHSPTKQNATEDPAMGTDCANVRLSPVPQAWPPHSSIMEQVDYQAYSRGTRRAHSRVSSLDSVQTKLMPQLKDLSYNAWGRQPISTPIYPMTTSTSAEHLAGSDAEMSHTAYSNRWNYASELDHWQTTNSASELVPDIEAVLSTHLRSRGLPAEDPTYKEPTYNLAYPDVEYAGTDEYENNDLVQHEQSWRGLLKSPSRRLHTGLKQSTQDDDLAGFWRSQRL